MSYATTTKVGDVCGFSFSETSSPVTSTQVGEYIYSIEAEMRGALDLGGYDPDPTDATAVSILELYCSLGAAAMVMQARKEPETATVFQRRYDAWLALVRQGKAGGLAHAGTAALLPSSRYTKYPSNYPAPAFRRGEVQW